MTSTRRANDSASVNARFTTVSVLPSPGNALVIITVLSALSTCSSCSAAASLRYCSTDTALGVLLTRRARSLEFSVSAPQAFGADATSLAGTTAGSA